MRRSGGEGHKLSQQGAESAQHADDLEHELVRLERALAQREMIGQATGILMVEYRISPGDAAAMLTRMGDGESLKPADMAEMIVRDRTPPARA